MDGKCQACASRFHAGHECVVSAVMRQARMKKHLPPFVLSAKALAEAAMRRAQHRARQRH